jgi:GNAT superfamily N-acetyltransferase
VTALRVERITGAEVLRYIDDLARLRITVFREFPYLYEGSLDYERRYLESYARSPHSVVVLARDGTTVVGASTAMPLGEHGENLEPVFTAARIEPDGVFYFGESVLAREHRGKGLGHAFFDEREAAARAYGAKLCAFCAVVRSGAHPLRPRDYVPHDAFWTRRGYQKRADITARFAWPDVGETAETEKTMVFWLKELSP